LKTAYLTDEFSTLGGLGAVAYKDPEYFREVQNQIYLQSPTGFTNAQRPSDIFEAFVGNKGVITDRVVKVLEKEYQSNEEFADYVDVEIGPGWRQTLERSFYSTLRRELNSSSFYGTTLREYLANTLNIVFPGVPLVSDLSQKAAQELDKIPTSSAEASFATLVATNNPQSKLSVPPPNSQIALENSVPLGLDYRGVEYVTGYSTLKDYWGDVPYPGMTSPSVIPATFKDSILGGLVGYLSQNPLEALYNPVGAGAIGNENFSSGAALNFSDPFGSGFVLGQIPFLGQEIADTYAISLIGEGLNGVTSYDPETMSNGDAIGARFIPQFEAENPDSGGGLPALPRAFNPAF
jgi:hypothetical protein